MDVVVNFNKPGDISSQQAVLKVKKIYHAREWGGGHGVFSYYLIEGLKGAADFDKSGSVSVGEITVYVSQQVRRATRNAENPIVAGRFDPSLVIGK